MQAVTVTNLAKRYRLYHRPLDRFRDWLHGGRRSYHQDFFALRNVTFAVRPGETVGIIGRNGSGKSTLLKLIAGILTPTEGAVRVQGRLAALLELGVGFNPELTGLENYYFSGAIMGFSRRELDARREAVTAFADIGDYLDQPVKTYSSGMFVRLAFAVAVTVDPDILIVDEALAVGDLNFQARCFRRLDEFRAAGKTILLVTHALDSVLRYASRVLLLDKGRLLLDADPKEGVDAYKQLLAHCYDAAPAGPEPAARPAGANPDARIYGNSRAEITDFALEDEHGAPVSFLQHGRRFRVRMTVRFHEAVREPIFAFTIKDLKGMEITGTNTHFKQVPTGDCRAGERREVRFSQVWPGAPGAYALSLGCTGYEGDTMLVYHRLYDILLFESVSDRPMVGWYDLNSEVEVSPAG